MNRTLLLIAWASSVITGLSSCTVQDNNAAMEKCIEERQLDNQDCFQKNGPLTYDDIKNSSPKIKPVAECDAEAVKKYLNCIEKVKQEK